MTLEPGALSRSDAAQNLPILIALAFSLAVHLMGLMLLQVEPVPGVPEHAAPSPAKLSVALVHRQFLGAVAVPPAGQAGVRASSSAVLKEIRVLQYELRENKVQWRDATPQGAARGLSEPLPLQLDELRELLRDVPSAAVEPPQGGTSENGATILNAEVYRAVQGAKRKTGYIVSPQTAGQDLAYDGGAWSELVVVGDRCFKVRRANPLQAISDDVWYRVACR